MKILLRLDRLGSVTNLLRSNAIRAAAVFTFVGLMGYGYFLFRAYYDKNEILNFCQTYGDGVAGFVGTIFTLSGVFMFFAALVDQQKAIQLQQTELKETREMFERQKFETTFFNLLQNHIVMTNELVLRNPANNQEEAKGRACFRVIWKEKLTQHLDKSNPVETLMETYTNRRFRETYLNEINHYFNNFYRLMEYAAEYNPVKNPTPEKFVRLVKDQLSLFELNVILLHQRTGLFSGEIAHWTEDYDLFSMLRSEKEDVVKALLRLKDRPQQQKPRRRKPKKPRADISKK